MSKKAYLCPHCGSTDILFMAFAKWDYEAQKFLFTETNDTDLDIYNNCDSKIVSIELKVVS